MNINFLYSSTQKAIVSYTQKREKGSTQLNDARKLNSSKIYIISAWKVKKNMKRDLKKAPNFYCTQFFLLKEGVVWKSLKLMMATFPRLYISIHWATIILIRPLMGFYASVIFYCSFLILNIIGLKPSIYVLFLFLSVAIFLFFFCSFFSFFYKWNWKRFVPYLTYNLLSSIFRLINFYLIRIL